MKNIIIMTICIFAILGIAYLLSEDKRRVNKKTVLVGTALLAGLVLFVIKTSVGAMLLEKIALGVDQLSKFGLEGVGFVFGELSTNTYIFAINVLSLLVFTSTLISVLNYVGVLPFIIKHLGGALSKILGIGKAEAICAVGNTLLGQTEAPLLTKPYLKSLNDSELFAVLVSGMGSASASILIGYSMLGIPMEYLLVAIFAVPFSTIVISKIMKPSDEGTLDNVEVSKSEAQSLFDAISMGCQDGLNLALNVGASLIAFVGLIALINGFLGLFGVSLSSILGFILTPLAWIFNIPASEVSTFASLMGTKISVNEFVAFTEMSTVLDSLSPRTIAILASSMCNFGAISSIGIMLGGLSAIEPSIRPRVSKYATKALIGAILSSLLTGAFVGLFF